MSVMRSDSADVLIIIPTIGKPETLLPAMDRLFQHLDGLRVNIVVVLNPVRREDANRSERGLKYLWEQTSPKRALLSVFRVPDACGFGAAINIALRYVTIQLNYEYFEFTNNVYQSEDNLCWSASGIPDLTVIFNDDLVVTEGWLQSLVQAAKTQQIRIWSEAPTENGKQPIRDVKDYGKIGLIGPATNYCAGIQQIDKENADAFKAIGPDEFARQWRDLHVREIYSATFLSGFCMGIVAELIDELHFYDNAGQFCLFDERYRIAGYEDNDLCVRADLKGWRCAVAAESFVGHIGHQSFDTEFPEMKRGMRNRLTYYDIWKPTIEKQGKRIVASYRVKFEVPHDFDLMRMSVASIGMLVDGISVILTASLGLVSKSSEWAEGLARHAIGADTIELVTGSIRNPENDCRTLRQWIMEWSRKPERSRLPDVIVSSWNNPFNERLERNEGIAQAMEMQADWILSIDHDETVEPRVTREHLERLMKHPDPLVQEWNVSFVNHWANNRWTNQTPPWGDGGSYRGGMHGYRFFRVNHASPRFIQAGGTNGLHCGNVPEVDIMAKRISGVRIRHFGYMRAQDRFRKLDRYNEQDPTPNPILVGGTSYAHITHEENQTMSVFVPENGIGFYMLVYEKENPDDVGRILDLMYGLADRIVLVWTGEWKDEDFLHTYTTRNEPGTIWKPSINMWDDTIAANWPRTGPSLEMAKMAEHFGAEWIRQPLNDDLAKARNAALDALHGTPGMGWAFFLDPDEDLGFAGNLASLRRMAEVSDCWGWIFTFKNMYADGHHNESEAVRMSRLDSQRVMRMNGRVHETFADATRKLVNQGYGTVIRRAPFSLINAGLSFDPEQMDKKLLTYRRLTELELQDNPHNCGAWTTLGLFWLGEGCPMTANECFSRAMLCAGDSYLPFQEAAFYHLRFARDCMREAVERMGNHHHRNINEAVVDFLDRAAPPLPPLGLANRGRLPLTDEEAMITLPPFEPPDGTNVDAGTFASKSNAE